jgi:hypothetical protein
MTAAGPASAIARWARVLAARPASGVSAIARRALIRKHAPASSTPMLCTATAWSSDRLISGAGNR